jgi:3-phenylpropionate/trans-cinnamate dioxygenase ferredoxin reductase subunit
VEHWANALNQGPAAARNMLGMEYTGLARDWDRVVLRGDTVAREFIAFWLVDDRVVAGMNVNVWGVMDAIKLLIRERVPVDAGTLSDLDVTLEELGHVAKGGVA